jgi:hypothetical protein
MIFYTKLVAAVGFSSRISQHPPPLSFSNIYTLTEINNHEELSVF